MRSTIRIMLLAAFTALTLGQSTLWSQGEPVNAAYTVFRLAVPGAASTETNDLNNSSNVVGTFYDANDTPYGFFYHHANKTYVSLGQEPMFWE